MWKEALEPLEEASASLVQGSRTIGGDQEAVNLFFGVSLRSRPLKANKGSQVFRIAFFFLHDFFCSFSRRDASWPLWRSCDAITGQLSFESVAGLGQNKANARVLCASLCPPNAQISYEFHTF